jgi:hypothetical protein
MNVAIAKGSQTQRERACALYLNPLAEMRQMTSNHDTKRSAPTVRFVAHLLAIMNTYSITVILRWHLPQPARKIIEQNRRRIARLGRAHQPVLGRISIADRPRPRQIPTPVIA